MKLVTLLLEPFRLDAVRRDFEVTGVQGMTVSEASASGAGHVETYRGRQVTTGLDPFVRVDVLVQDQDVEELVSAALAAGQDGDRPSAGRLWVTPVEQVVRIRTGERGVEAV